MATSDQVTAPAAGTFGRDFLASIVVFLVALPLCMGISIASGLPPTTGIITGIIGGIVVASISGAPLQVSGPAAGLTVLVYMLVQEQGAAMLGTIVLFAGLIQMLAGVLKLGQWFRAVSPAVIHGMLAGIGVLIFASQFHVMLDGKPLGSGVQNLIGIPGALFEAIRTGDSRQTAGLVGLLTIATIVGWSAFAPKSLRLVPAPLVGVVVAVIAAYILGLASIKFVDVPSNIWEWSLQMYPTPDKLAPHHRAEHTDRRHLDCIHRQRRNAAVRDRGRSDALRSPHEVRQGAFRTGRRQLDLRNSRRSADDGRHRALERQRRCGRADAAFRHPSWLLAVAAGRVPAGGSASHSLGGPCRRPRLHGLQARLPEDLADAEELWLGRGCDLLHHHRDDCADQPAWMACLLASAFRS